MTTPATALPEEPPAAITTAAGALDALDFLCREHEDARSLAEECRRHARSFSPDPAARERAQRLCRLLQRLSEIEEGLFYPVARAALDSPQLVDLAALEHATARQITRQLQACEPTEPRFEALLLALTDCVTRHVKHEQDELFPQLRRVPLDLCALGERLQARRFEPRPTITH